MAMAAYRYSTDEPPGQFELQPGEAKVTEVVDARTLLVNQQGHEARIRLLGISSSLRDADAIAWLTDNLSGIVVDLTFDKRRVAVDGAHYAYVECLGQSINVELVQKGLAKHAPYPGDSASMSKILSAAGK